MNGLFEDFSKSLLNAVPFIGLFGITFLMIAAIIFAFMILSNLCIGFLDSFPKASNLLGLLMLPLLAIGEIFQILYAAAVIGGFFAVPIGIFSAIFGVSFIKLYSISVVMLIFYLRKDLFELVTARYKP